MEKRQKNSESERHAILISYAWREHCRGLFHTPTAARLQIRNAGGRAAIRTVTTYAVSDNGAYYSLFRDLTDAFVAVVGDVEISICNHDHIVQFSRLSFGGGAPSTPWPALPFPATVVNAEKVISAAGGCFSGRCSDCCSAPPLRRRVTKSRTSPKR